MSETTEINITGNEPAIELHNIDKPVSFRDLPTYEHNPFIEPILSMKIKNKIVQISSTPNMVVNSAGEYMGDSKMIVTRKVDKEEFVKVFKDQLTIIFELSKTAQRVLTYFIKMLGMNEDYVIFDKNKAKQYSGLNSTVSIYTGLTELIQKNVIARSNLTQIYFINPAILFNGDRLVVVNAWMRDDKMGLSSPENAEDWKDKQKSIPESSNSEEPL
jgi:hypothetical protein